MILIRASGKIDYSELPSLPPAIKAILDAIPGYTEINSDQSLLDGRYTASELRLVADVMEWHSRNEQRPIEMFTSPTVCQSCSAPLTHDAYESQAGSFCFKCAYTQVTA